MLDLRTFLEVAIPVAGAVAWLDRRFARLVTGVARLGVHLGHVDAGLQSLGRDFAVLRDNHIAHLTADVTRLGVMQGETRESIRQLAARDAFIEQQLAEISRPR